MRIIAGELRNRPIKPPPEHAMTRPIPARVKESMFGVLRGVFDGGVVLDLFAGTGSIGLEAISRGADRCVCVEQDRKVARILEQNARELGVSDRVDVVTGDALGPAVFVRCNEPLRAVFLDPPYPMVRTHEGWDRVRAQIERLLARLEPEGYLIVRTPWPFNIGDPTETNDAHSAHKRNSPRSALRSAHHDRTKGTRGKLPSKREFDRMMAREIEHGLLHGQEIDPVTGEPVEPRHASRKRTHDDDAHGNDIAEPVVIQPADMHIPGACGPETHAIRQTAFHLYMRDDSGE